MGSAWPPAKPEYWVRGASGQAAALGHRRMGEEHILLALVAGEDDDPARAALVAAGVTHEAAREAVRAWTATDGPPAAEENEGIRSVASFHDALAAATCVQLGRGHAALDSVDMLLGLLSLSAGATRRLLGDLGIGGDTVTGALEDSGVQEAGRFVTALANPLRVAAERESRRLQVGHVGPQMVLLALLSGKPDDLAQRALAAVGIEASRYEERFAEARRRSYPPMRPPDPGATAISPNPVTRLLFGRAEGFAAAAGSDQVRSEHGLLAWLWDPAGGSVLELEGLSTSAEALLGALADLGVAVPAMPPPEPDRTPWGEMVFLPTDRLSEVIDELTRLSLPVGSWGFNTYDGRSWVHGYAQIDLRSIVDLVLARAPRRE